MPDRPYLPVALNLAGRSAVVIGGGEPAYDKVTYLADFGLAIGVVADPAWPFDERLNSAARDGVIRLARERFAPAHLEGHWLAVISTGDRERDRDFARQAKAAGLLVNVVDDPDHCDFFASAYVKRGPVSVAINTGGVSAGFSAAFRQYLEGLIGPEVEDQVAHYRVWRDVVRGAIPRAADRERLWREVRAEGLYDVLRTQGPDAARRIIDAKLAVFPRAG